MYFHTNKQTKKQVAEKLSGKSDIYSTFWWIKSGLKKKNLSKQEKIKLKKMLKSVEKKINNENTPRL